ncbi:COBRA-like protein 7, partial [Bienertia sinuspersici]
LKSWRVYVGFHHDEILVSTSNAVTADGSSLPAKVGEDGAVFAGYPQSDIKTGIQTAGDLKQTSVKVEFEGTQFGVAPLNAPLPINITLINDGYVSPPSSKSEESPAPAPSPNLCNGIWLSYRYEDGKKIHPLKTLPKQPYSFKSALTILNNDYVELEAWQVFVGFQHDELLVSATNVVLANGSSLPGLVGEGTIFAGYPVDSLKTGIQTAGDVEQMMVEIEFEGTQFGVAPPDVPLPKNISLVNDGYLSSMAANTFTFTIILLFSLLSLSSAQPPTPKKPPSSDTCNGIWLTYTYGSGNKLHPYLKTPSKQPYTFKSTLTILNNDDVELKSWRVYVGFHHDEILVSASNAVTADGSSLPAKVGEDGAVFAGYPQSDIKTGIQTAGDLKQTSVKVEFEGTQFGVAPPNAPLPINITLVNDGYVCPPSSKSGNFTLNTCCERDPDFKSNMTIKSDKFLPRKKGDLTIMYDVTKSYEGSYWAQVTMTNHNPLGRLDYWKLNWDWMQDEFIVAMKGAHPDIIDANDCVNGPQAAQYPGLDWSTVMNCERRPTIIDLPLQFANNTELGKIPFCCRNGTILPESMDETQSVSSFLIQVNKMPPNMNKSLIEPPQNWQISGVLNPTYKCGPPVRVSPSEVPSPNGVPVNVTVFASWQVVCNITKPKNVAPKCCVSFSSYVNESIIPCKTCACGCPDKTSQTCSTTAPAMFIPPEAQLIPFENRTRLSLAWAAINHRAVPNPLPCSDNCGVSINWHVSTDYNKGWSARVTLFNWGETEFADWFVAAELKNAAPGFEKAYSFNGTLMTDVKNTIFMQGLEGLNYLMGETNGTKPSDPRIPGKQQSVLSFTKKPTPGVKIIERDGFPTKVYFNGEECSLPEIIPIKSGGYKKGPLTVISALIVTLVLFIIEQ